MQRPSSLDLSISRNIHIVGIGGSGMSSIAGVLAAMGNKVSGSDAVASSVLAHLVDQGIEARVGHDDSALPERLDAVAVSTAVGPDNPEVIEAERRGLPVLRRAEVLTAIAGTRRSIAVAGTHGKTTTSSMLATLLEAGGLQPSWIVGGEVLGRGGGAHWDSGEWIVIEADESDGTFLELDAEAVIVTSVEPDHLEYYGGEAPMRQAFVDFVNNARGPRVVCIDDPGARQLCASADASTYGVSKDADYVVSAVDLGAFEARFELAGPDGTAASVHLPVPGMHNVRNATAALAMAHHLGLSLESAATGFESYGGVGRRFQLRGKKNGVTFVDDYAHLPGEVAAVLAAARAGGWNRVVAVFQPHRYSRTAQVGGDFGRAFDDADLLILTDVHAAGEPPRSGVDGRVVLRAVQTEKDAPETTYIEDREQLATYVADLLEEGDLCISLGAGDITRLAVEIQEVMT